ncbi:unnamed protein product [Periconia digitata]|uniref:Uncharacterized protein n=1 Tax=Periconia digitata TaxID=1303443 RepID=A0A9W4XRW8_9PLEO|nr:unnamed protein product [Periconia digitata]
MWVFASVSGIVCAGRYYYTQESPFSSCLPPDNRQIPATSTAKTNKSQNLSSSIQNEPENCPEREFKYFMDLPRELRDLIYWQSFLDLLGRDRALWQPGILSVGNKQVRTEAAQIYLKTIDFFVFYAPVQIEQHLKYLELENPKSLVRGLSFGLFPCAHENPCYQPNSRRSFNYAGHYINLRRLRLVCHRIFCSRYLEEPIGPKIPVETSMEYLGLRALLECKKLEYIQLEADSAEEIMDSLFKKIAFWLKENLPMGKDSVKVWQYSKDNTGENPWTLL